MILLTILYISPYAYYIPCTRFDESVRPLLTQEEIYSIIDDMPAVEEKWIADRNERQSVFSRTLHSDDYRKLLSMIKGLYTEQQKRISDGKNLPPMTKKLLQRLKKLCTGNFPLYWELMRKMSTALLKAD